MSKMIFISDIHINQNNALIQREIVKQLGKIEQIILQIEEQQEEKEKLHIFFLGDLVEKYPTWYNPALTPLLVLIDKLYKKHNLYFLLGNHDGVLNTQKKNILQPLKKTYPNITCIQETQELVIENTKLLCIPFYRRPEQTITVAKDIDLIVIHNTIAEFNIPNDVTRQPLIREFKNAVLAAHIHIPSNYPQENIMIPGSIIPLNYTQQSTSDGEQETRKLLILNTKTKQWSMPTLPVDLSFVTDIQTEEQLQDKILELQGISDLETINTIYVLPHRLKGNLIPQDLISFFLFSSTNLIGGLEMPTVETSIAEIENLKSMTLEEFILSIQEDLIASNIDSNLEMNEILNIIYTHIRKVLQDKKAE